MTDLGAAVTRAAACAVAAALTALPACAAAQNTGGVFPPMVTEGASALEYRATLRPQDGEDGLAQRIHYQRALNTRVMWRLVGQVSGTTDDQDADFVQGELFWELSEDADAWRTGLRFDLQVREGAAPEQVNASWTNQFPVGEALTGRFVALSKVQIGDRAADGVAFETRANLFRTTSGGTVLGVESYNLHGSTVDFDAFGGRQQVGPFAVFPVADGWALFTGALFGANDESPDTDLRVWLTRNF